MKKAFIVTSSIEVDNSNPLTYSKTRTYFSSEERFRQTIATIASIDQASDNETDIFLLDTSEHWYQYCQHFTYQPNLIFVSVKEELPEIYNEVKTHPNKTRCEALILSEFMKKNKQALSEYDFQFKMSGRYFLDKKFDISLFNESTAGKIFYKRYMEHAWQDSWMYDLVDRRTQQGDNNLRQYCSVLFGWSKQYQERYQMMFETISLMLSNPVLYHFDHETLGYYLTRTYQDDIIETDWLVYGFHGHDGKFVRY